MRKEHEAMAAIEVKGLTHRYGQVTALNDVKFTVPEGAMYALLGTNGAGKTTMLQILAGLLHPADGVVRVLGKEVKDLTFADRAHIGYVSEAVRLPSWMNLRQLEKWLAPLYPTWDHDLADELRDRFGLSADRNLKTLSRGEHMKAALLVSLAPRPRLLLMDEPFTGIDAMTKDELTRGLLETASSGRWTVLVCTHDIAEIEPLADWVGILDRGRLRVSESMESIYARFKRVDVLSRNGQLGKPGEVPEDWLAVESAGARLSFLTQEPDASDDAAVRLWVPEAAQIDVRPASLREVFIALARQRREEAPLS